MIEWIWNKKLNCYCAKNNSTIRADKNGDVFGGGGDPPQAPSQPSTADAVNAWIQGMPQVYQTQMEYAPKQAAQAVELAKTYAQPYGEAMKTAQEALYPGTSAIQEKLANQALTGMDSTIPDWMKQQYQSNVNANLGTNVGSGMSADYVSRGLLEQQKGWNDYYRNLGLSVSGRQPLTQASTPSTTDYMSQFTPNSVMNYMSNGYNTAAGIYGKSTFW